MIFKHKILMFTAFVCQLSLSCVRDTSHQDSKVSVIPPAGSSQDLERKFRDQVYDILNLIRRAHESSRTGRQVGDSWGLPIYSRDGRDVIATFYFKIFRGDFGSPYASNGPDIFVEFLDDTEWVSLYLESTRSARPAFLPTNPGGEVPALKAFKLLAQEAQRDNSERSVILRSLASKLNELVNLTLGTPTSTDVPSDVPSKFKKYEGRDPDGQACYVNVTTDADDKILKVTAGYKAPYGTFEVRSYWLGVIRAGFLNKCSTIEYKSASGDSSLRREGPIFGIEYHKVWKSRQTNDGSTSSRSTTMEALAGGMYVVSGCRSTQVTMCQDRLQITRFYVGGFFMPMFPILSGTLHENSKIDCRDLRVVN